MHQRLVFQPQRDLGIRHKTSLIDFDFIVLSPAGAADARLPIAASRAGALGVLNLEVTADHDTAVAAMSQLSEHGRGRWGVLLRDPPPAGLRMSGLELAILTTPRPELVDAVHAAGARAFGVATDLDGARAAEAAGVDAVIAKGHEAGGWVGEESTFVLLQRLVRELSVPVWAHGGVGLHTAAACHVAGARGAVLDAQVLLARESPLSPAARGRLAAMDGSETACLGTELGAPVRVFARPDLPGVAELRDVEAALERRRDGSAAADGREDAPQAADAWRAAVADRLDWRDRDGAVLAAGQDAAFAADLARRFVTVGGIVAALREAVGEQCRAAQRTDPLAERAPLARAHGTRYPLVQGPMTRVSDRAEFAAAVADAGALPFLALALMRGPEANALLERAADLLGDRPWGVGILGFVPAELRAEQLDAIRAHRPPFALIAGGRPDQARALEEDGIATYLHVPSPGLLELYLKDGARRFVFEGRECGGHVGPRTSFVLWDTMVRALLAAGPDDCHVLLAGGIHDGLSAAMAATVAAPLAERGMRVGALMGTAYLFCEEAVEAGAIAPGFQRAALAGDRTVLLQSGPGHATRCLASPFADDFHAEKRRLRDLTSDELRDRLEELNIGRLRIAAKGADRHPRFGDDPAAPKLIELGPDEQWTRGLYMIGQVAALRDRVGGIADLHREVADGGSERLRALPRGETVDEPAPPPADVAIVGIGCIFPGAPDLRTFWANILDKVDAIGEVPADRWDWRRYFDPDPAAPDRIYSRWGGFVDDVPFDPVELGMPPSSLRSIEPFQLLGLEAARAALRDAGYAERPFPRERTSVILGAGGGGGDLAVGYTVRSSLPTLFDDPPPRLNARLPEWTEDSFPGLLMNVAAGRIANRLDLGGTNFTVDAACGSSLAAIALAVRDLQNGGSDMAIAGGVDAIQNPFAYLCFSKTHALSPTGRCRTFDAEADGIAISEGFAAVILKRLADAERDGDRVYAVIRGVGSASDGRDRSLTAPRPEGQMRALRRAYAHAGVSPATIGLVEAHGTGTVAGDRSEVQALSSVFGEAGAEPEACAIGSVKSMIGHTKAAAGVAGLIKAALALHRRVLPPTLGVSAPNAGFPDSPFHVNSETRPWIHAEEHPRRAAVSAFGFGGTNFHAVLEEYTGDFLDDRAAAPHPWPADLLLWRGRSRAEIAAQLDRPLAERTREGPLTLAIVAESDDDLARKLQIARELLAGDAERRHGPDGVHYAEEPLAAAGRVAFLFPGQGSQYVDMARELAVAFPAARERFERADRVLGRPLSHFVFPPPAFAEEDERRRQAELTETNVAQPALGAADLAWLHVLRDLGVEPQMAAGHSYGELVALAAAGSLDEDDLLRLSEARGRFIREGAADESGAMAAVDAGPDALRPLLAGDLVLANLNAPEQTVVSGSRAGIDRALQWCADRGLRARRLPVACAFHSPYVAPAQRRLAELLARTAIAPPRIPVYSNTTAGPYPDEPGAIAELLGEHLVRPVEFVREIEAMHADGARIFVESGPRSVLTGLVGRILGERPHLGVSADQHGRSGAVSLLHCLAALAAEGVPVRAERLVRDRAAVASPSSTTWLVNGGRARPLHDAEETPETMYDGNGAHSNGRPAEVERALDVMGRHQQTMQRFLDTQRSVMLAYLGQAPAPALEGNGAASTGGPATGIPAPAVLAPAPAAHAPAAVHSPAGHPPAVHSPALPEAAPAPPADGIADRLLAIVSDRTGYPPDMLGLDADLEADLGIDSIKRVEIVGTIAESLSLADGAVDVEELTSSRTLREVIAGLEAAANGSARPFDREPAEEEERIGRFLPRVVSAPPIAATAGLRDGVVAIVDDGAGVGEALARRLGDRAVRVAPGDPLPSPVAGLVCLAPDLAELLRLVQALQDDRDGVVVLGGGGAIAGFLKTLALEWPEARVKAVDVGEAAAEEAADRLLDELTADDGLVEVGCRDGVRTRVILEPAPLNGRPSADPLDEESVVLVTGGARGITAEVALELAERYRPTLILVGRTPPGEEDDLPDDPRSALVERAGGDATPAAIEAEVRRVLAAREVRTSLARLREAGARVAYEVCDVRDGDAFGTLIDRVYTELGRIDGVIHGAGVIEDKLIRDKRPASLRRVLDTKVASARTLSERLRPDDLRFLVLFGSVSARFGNRGQADYAAAGEELNRIARELDGRWPGRVVSINWGPWAGAGMVAPEVARQFARRGVALIAPAAGRRRFDEELRLGRKGEAEVLIGAAPPGPLLSANSALTRTAGAVEVARTLDVEHDVYLDDHRLDGRPVLPFAVAMELMAEVAGMAGAVVELRDVTVLKGVTVEGRAQVRVVAEGEDVTVTDGERPRYRARVIVADGPRDAAEADVAPLDALEPFPMSVDDAYRDLLFHGPRFQGIAAIEGIGEEGARSVLTPSDPAACLRGAPPTGWLIDPIVIDSALQVQLLWARLRWDVTLLPSELASCRVHGFGDGPIRHEMRIRPDSRRPLCRGDHRFYDAGGRLIATLTDMRAAGSRALNRLATA